jgi:hypothetical protein
MKKLLLSSIIVLSVSLFFTACSKEGPAGPAGTAGSAGPAGPAGPTGSTGSANVIYSAWFNPATWVAENNFGDMERTYTMTSTTVTQNIIDRGIIMVYMRFVGYDPAISQLPFELPNSDKTFSFRAQAGSVKALYTKTSNHALDPGVIPSSNAVRYVLIPGAVSGGRGVNTEKTADINGQYYKESQLKNMSYDQICSLLQIAQ